MMITWRAAGCIFPDWMRHSGFKWFFPDGIPFCFNVVERQDIEGWTVIERHWPSIGITQTTLGKFATEEQACDHASRRIIALRVGLVTKKLNLDPVNEKAEELVF